MIFEVSVILPVFNTEAYVAKAIHSALIQTEVKEVIVINDGSTDNTDAIINKLAEANTKIKIYYHANKKNKGRSASRNLGIQKATSKYIAFLDADDYYLDNRFKNDQIIFEKDNNIGGVYNAIGAHFYREVSPEEKVNFNLTTVTKKIEPKLLFDALLTSRYGYFSIDGLTIKKAVFNKTGIFNVKLEVTEDTDLIWKMALTCRLEPGIIDQPLAMRGVHTTNAFTNNQLYEEYNLKLYESMLFWSCKNKIAIKTIERFVERLWILKCRQTHSILTKIKYWFYLTSKTPKTLFTYITIKYFPLVRYRKALFSFIYKNNN